MNIFIGIATNGGSELTSEQKSSKPSEQADGQKSYKERWKQVGAETEQEYPCGTCFGRGYQFTDDIHYCTTCRGRGWVRG